MTPSELKHRLEWSRHGSNFFSHQAMKCFGDTMSNFGCRSATVKTRDGAQVECWELWRKRPVKHGFASSAYFDKASFERVFPIKDWE